MTTRLPRFRNMEEAYSFLAKQDDRYEVYEHREDGDLVVVFFPETMTVRLFKNLEEVGKFYNWDTFRYAVNVKPEQFVAKYSVAKLEEFCEYAGIDIQGLTLYEQARKFWAWCQEVGDRVTNREFGGQVQEDPDKYQIRVDLLKDTQMQELIATLPKQARVVAEGFATAEKTAYSELELESFARELVISGRLKTKQNPDRIVRYYLPTLADMGLAYYPTKRHKVEQELVGA